MADGGSPLLCYGKHKLLFMLPDDNGDGGDDDDSDNVSCKLAPKIYTSGT